MSGLFSSKLPDIEPAARDVTLGLGVLVGGSEGAVVVWRTVSLRRSTDRILSSHPVESNLELDCEFETEVGLLSVSVDGGGVDELVLARI